MAPTGERARQHGPSRRVGTLFFQEWRRESPWNATRESQLLRRIGDDMEAARRNDIGGIISSGHQRKRRVLEPTVDKKYVARLGAGQQRGAVGVRIINSYQADGLRINWRHVG